MLLANANYIPMSIMLVDNQQPYHPPNKPVTPYVDSSGIKALSVCMTTARRFGGMLDWMSCPLCPVHVAPRL